MRRHVFISSIILSVFGLIAAGCGGGASAGGSGGNNAAQLGPLQISYTGAAAKPLILSSGNVSVTSMGGATFSSVNFAGTNDLNQTKILFTRGAQIWSVSPNGYAPQELTSMFEYF